MMLRSSVCYFRGSTLLKNAPISQEFSGRVFSSNSKSILVVPGSKSVPDSPTASDAANDSVFSWMSDRQLSSAMDHLDRHKRGGVSTISEKSLKDYEKTIRKEYKGLMKPVRKQRPRSGVPVTIQQQKASTKIERILHNILDDELVPLPYHPDTELDIVDVRVNRNCGQATVVWTLPKPRDMGSRAHKLLCAKMERVLVKVTGQFRYHLTLRLNSKYSPVLIFRRDEAESRIQQVEHAFQRMEEEGGLDHHLLFDPDSDDEENEEGY